MAKKIKPNVINVLPEESEISVDCGNGMISIVNIFGKVRKLKHVQGKQFEMILYRNKYYIANNWFTTLIMKIRLLRK